MPYSRRYYRKKRYGYSAKRGYRKASRYRRRYGGYRRRTYGRYGANRKISSINRRLYALLKSMDMRFKFTRPYFSVVDRKKKKLSRRKSYRSTKAQLAAMEAIKLKAAAKMQARHAASLAAADEDVDMPPLESQEAFAAILNTQPSLRYSTESFSDIP